MSNIRISSQYLKNLSFKSPGAPDIFFKPSTKPNIELSIDLDAKKLSEESYEVIIKIKAEADKSKMFICEAEYAGIFVMQNIEVNMIEQVLLVYCPNLLFPFIRKIICDATSAGGFPPLMIDPIDFSALYQKRKKAN